MRKILFILMPLLWAIPPLMAQQRTIAGRVLNAIDKTPVSGATIRVEGTSATTVSDDAGNFSVEAPATNITLIVTSIGYEAATLPVTAGNSNDVTVFLQASSDELEEVVVTALGIERKAKSLTYSTQAVKGEELTKVKDVNPINALTGKISGLQINRSSSGMGGSVNIILRGFKSNRNNQPLYVVDGLPITNTGGSGPTGPFGGGTDRGDILSTLNPDDIASINVLKGASASALYGSQGANGAIMITTKKGAEGRMHIELSSGVTFDQAFYLPELQYRYGQTTSDSEESWGDPGTFSDPVDGFFNTGTTYLNTISLSGGTEKMQNYFSYGNTTNNGVLPTNTFKQHSLTFRNSTSFFEDRLKFDGSLMYAKQDVHNRPASGLYFGPLSGLYMFPRGQDFNHYKKRTSNTSLKRATYTFRIGGISITTRA